MLTFSYKVKNEIVALLDLTLDFILGEIEIPDNNDINSTIIDSAELASSHSLWGSDGRYLDEVYDPELVLYAIVLCQMTVSKSRIIFKTAHQNLAKLLNRIFLASFGIELNFKTYNELIKLTCSDSDSLERLFRRVKSSLSFDIDNSRESYSFLDFDEAQKIAILQAVFLSGGAITDPVSKYSIELVIKRLTFSEAFKDLLAEFEINYTYYYKNANHYIYIKNSNDIAKFLGIIGAQQTLLQFEACRVEKDMRNSINRAVNCDKANASRLVKAASKQILAINFLKEKGCFNALPDELKKIAELRLEFPEFSLNDLVSEQASLGISISRSSLMRKLNNIINIAEKNGFK